MTTNDIWALIYSYVYAFGLLGIIEFIGKKAGWPQWVTRKFVHIGAGMWVWGIWYFFDTWYIGIIPFATFIVLNYIFYRYRIFKTMDEEDSSPGTVYFAFSITLLFLLFWRKGLPQDRVYLAIAPIMAMTWGDALASLIGKGFGRHSYTIFNHTRSWEGSLVMFLVSFFAVFISLNILPGMPSILLPAITAAAVAAIAEGLSPFGTDNLTVPLITACVLWLWLI